MLYELRYAQTKWNSTLQNDKTFPVNEQVQVSGAQLYSAGGFVTQMESSRIIILEAKRFYVWKVHGKNFRKKYVANFFLSICAFYRPDRNDVIKSKNCYETIFVAFYSSKFCIK